MTTPKKFKPEQKKVKSYRLPVSVIEQIEKLSFSKKKTESEIVRDFILKGLKDEK